MRFRPGLLLGVGFVLLVGFLIYGSMPRVRSRCEVCLEFGAETVCRKGAGATEAEARMAAQESACGGNARGMSESIRCRNAEPVRVQCTKT